MFNFIDSIPSGWLYFFILLFKIVEVSISTFRIVIVTKGERLKGAIISFFEVSLWVILASTVLVDIASDPIKIFVYAGAFAIGNFLGSKMEETLALGTVKVEAIVKKLHGRPLAKALRAEGYAVTSVDGYGRDERREILYVHVPRRKIKETIALVRSFQEEVVITVTDIRPVYGGFGVLRK